MLQHIEALEQRGLIRDIVVAIMADTTAPTLLLGLLGALPLVLELRTQLAEGRLAVQ